MIETHLYLSFILITLGLIATPGPNVMLIVSNSLALGPRRGLLTVAGTSTAIAIQLAVAATAVTSVTFMLAELFTWLRWLGVIYLVYLAVMQFRAARAVDETKPPASARHTYAQGFAVALTNPKTMLFFVAFLPQFVAGDLPIPPQLLTLSVTFLVLAILGDGAIALLAARLRHVGRARWRRPVAGLLYLTAGVGLALARR